jgi:hypothetical protein
MYRGRRRRRMVGGREEEAEVSSIFSLSFHNFLLYFPNLIAIQLGFVPYFSYHFTIQLGFLPYFS